MNPPPNTAPPTGTVTFKDGSTVLQTVSLRDGSASSTTALLAVGKQFITATYNGKTLLDTATLSNGAASLKTTALAVGGNSITVVYGGDSHRLESCTRICAASRNSGRA